MGESQASGFFFFFGERISMLIMLRFKTYETITMSNRLTHIETNLSASLSYKHVLRNSLNLVTDD
jgi:hypothetical protein